MRRSSSISISAPMPADGSAASTTPPQKPTGPRGQMRPPRV
jgi:hypothetical protein